MAEFFPWWVGATYFLNLFFLLLLARSGLEALSTFPKLCWHDDRPPGREWVRFSKKMHSVDSLKPWSSSDEVEAWSPFITLPGKKNLGLGRHWHWHWHFMSIHFWVLTGVVYPAMVFATGYWHYLVPTHWSIIPDSTNSVGTYLHFQIPAMIPGEPFAPAPKLAHFTVLVLLLVLHVVITWLSLRYRRRTHRLLGIMVNPFERAVSKSFLSRESFRPKDISPYFRVNGYPPTSANYKQLAADEFRDYQLSIGGLVANPISLSLEELRRVGEQTKITKHNCIQGWTAVAQWGGVPLARIIELVEPQETAKLIVFYAFDDKGLTRGEGLYGFFYGTIPVHLAKNPQSILVLEMNGESLPIEHGAPVRVRLETQLGFKMVKWVCAIEFVEDYRDIGLGQGGWREDQQFYANAAGI